MGDARTGARAARGAKRPIRRRAVGTRDRIVSHLTAVGDIADVTGMASARLAEAVGYPGSSVAFAQLLSGMERDGLIVREVRGKRTYRITLPDRAEAEAEPLPAPPEAAGAGAARAGVAHPEPARAPSGFDYDELARRLLVQVLRKLAPVSAADDGLATVDAAGALAEPEPEPAPAEPAPTEPAPTARIAAERIAREKTAALQETVVGLERELANAWTRHTTLTVENAQLREQLSEARRDLARERTRRAPLSGELNQAEIVMLDRLLDAPAGNGDATAG